MNFKHLSYFVDISKRESFTKAADDIYVSQSALSKSVKSLEQELNVTLIDRTSKSFNLTEEGRILYAEGENDHTQHNPHQFGINAVSDLQGSLVLVLFHNKSLRFVFIPPRITHPAFCQVLCRWQCRD